MGMSPQRKAAGYLQGGDKSGLIGVQRLGSNHESAHHSVSSKVCIREASLVRWIVNKRGVACIAKGIVNSAPHDPFDVHVGKLT